MRALSTILVGAALAVLVVGISLYPLTHATFTRLLVQRYANQQQIGLPESSVKSVAEQVRRFIDDAESPPLPATVDGRPGFDAAAVSHLVDVRSVIAGARTVTGILAAIVAVWLATVIALRRFDYIPPALFFGAAMCVGIVVLGAVAGLLNFDALFTWFHGLFFAAGTWEFPADSLLIEVFPEPFWSTAAAVWAGLVLIGAGILAVAGGFVRSEVTGVFKGSAKEGPAADA
jgi:integral membrane protein (TIGR01906 family)